MPTASATTGYVDRRPRWRRRILRGLACGLTLLVVAYTTLPWWLPTGWIGQRLCNQLTDGLGRPASVGAVNISWSEGVTFSDLVIESLPEQPFPHFVRVGRLRCGFTPLTTLWTGRVNRIELIEPSLWLNFDEQGRITNLQKMGESDKLPTFEFALINPACHLVTPKTSQVFTLEKLTCHIHPEAGLVTIDGDTGEGRNSSTSPPDRFEIHARLNVPQLKKDIPFHSDIRILWKNLGLAQLPAPLVNELPIERMDGRTTGQLSIDVPESMQLGYNLEVGLDTVSVAFKNNVHPGRIPDARLACEGRFDPATEELIVRNFEFETPGLRVARPRGQPGPTMLIDQIGTEPFALHLEGDIKDFAIMQREFPALASALETLAVDLEGTATFTFSIQPSGTEDHITFRLDGLDASWRAAPGEPALLSAGRGVPKSIRLDLLRDRALQQVALKHFEIRMDEAWFEMRSEGMWDLDAFDRGDEKSLWTTLSGASLSGEMHFDDLQSLARVTPALAEMLNSRKWSGPLTASLVLEPISISPGHTPATQLTCKLDAPAVSVLDLGDFWVKPETVPLSFVLNAVWPREKIDRIHALDLRLSQGEFTLELMSDTSPVTWRLHSTRLAPDKEHSLEGRMEWNLPGHIRHIEHVRTWSPELQRMLEESGSTLSLSGDLDFTCNGHLMSTETEQAFWQRIVLDGDGLAVQLGDLIQKPAGAALSVSAEVCRMVSSDSRELSIEAKIGHSSTEIMARHTRTLPGEAANGTHSTSIDMNVHDAEALLDFIPAARTRLVDWHPQGKAHLKMTTLASGGELDVHLYLEADEAAWRIPGEQPVIKPAGVAAGADLRWQLTRIEPDIYTLALIDGQIDFDESGIRDLAGELSVQLPSAWEALSDTLARSSSTIGSRWLAERMPAGDVEFVATAAVTEKLRALSPDLNALLDRLNLTGRTEMKIQLRFDPQQLTLAWEADAAELGWDIPIGTPWLERELKAVGAPLQLAGALATTGWRDGAMTVTFEDVDVSMAGGLFGTAGQYTLKKRDDGRAEVDKAEVAFTLDIDDLVQWMASHPGMVDRASGALQAVGQIRWEDDLWRAESGSIACDEVSLTRGDTTLALNGDALWDEHGFGIHQLAWQWGESDGVISAEIQRLPYGNVPSYVGLSMGNMDIPGAVRRWQQLQQDLSGEAESETVTDLQAGQLVDGRPSWVVPFIAHAREHDYHIDVHADTMAVVLPLDIPATLDAVAANVRLVDGQCSLTFAALADGGSANGQLVTDLNVDAPQFHLTYTANRIEPGPLVNTYLLRTFPGMTAGGALTISDETYQKLFPRRGEPNPEVGQGELVIEGGVVEGRAAPEWMTRIFPNLNLTRYNFDYMHSWFDKMPSGRVRHRMIYQGNTYNIFMDGHTDPDQRMRYQVGIDLMADFDSRYWVDSGQGRIPLFVKTGTIRPDGTLAGERITYEPARRILNTIFISNNPVVTAYHAARKLALRKD